MDQEIADIVELEKARQWKGLELIPSENFTSVSVMQAIGSVMTNKYSEGYPGGGNECVLWKIFSWILRNGELEKSASLFRPKLIVAGASAYERLYDYTRICKVCDKQKAILLADIAHVSGLVASGGCLWFVKIDNVFKRALNNGLLVDPHDQTVTADALLKLVAHKNLWSECRRMA
ncbi:SHMT domain-containing protein [Cephalotus follicularis]|uniref:SHMT domain-containing protein n=1 Tax=Cephalotus follicularis TaxID=3775 RepID=A0A1Q3CFZ0_CEPFO|nr:SHMT domain-containing protein [Cephalotus follicularis]